MNNRMSLQGDTRDGAELSLHADELESLDALTDDGLSSDLGGCGVVFTFPLILT